MFGPQQLAICPQRWALRRSTYFEPQSFFATCALVIVRRAGLQTNVSQSLETITTHQFECGLVLRQGESLVSGDQRFHVFCCSQESSVGRIYTTRALVKWTWRRALRCRWRDKPLLGSGLSMTLVRFSSKKSCCWRRKWLIALARPSCAHDIACMMWCKLLRLAYG